MCVQNLKFVALPVREIIGGTQKIWAVPGYAHAPFSPKFFRAFVRMDPVNIPAKFEARSFIRSLDNRGYSKIWAVPVYAHAQFSPKFSWAFVRMNPVNIPAKFVALPIPEIIGGTQKNWAVPGYAKSPTLPFHQNFSWACVRVDPVNVSVKFAVRSSSRS